VRSFNLVDKKREAAGFNAGGFLFLAGFRNGLRWLNG